MLVFLYKLATSDRKLPYFSYLAGLSGYFFMFYGEGDTGGLTILVLFGISATIGLIGLFFSVTLGSGEMAENIFNEMEFKSHPVETRHKIIFFAAFCFMVILPWAVVFRLFD